MASLAAYVKRLRLAEPNAEFPDFDPFDGGIGAQILFLFEKPGPMTSNDGGSGFISRDNDDPSAEATFRFMKLAGIPREKTITWNIVPGWNGTRRITAEELRAGVRHLSELLELLPLLRVAMLVGGKAGRARELVRGLGLEVFQSPHPSPIVRASRPDLWNSIPQIWSRCV